MSDFPASFRSYFSARSSDLDLLVDALPTAGWKPEDYAIVSATPTSLLVDGDVIDLGDRAFEVMHLPGHSPGSIGLWEPKTGILFSGDAIYDGALFDFLPDSDVQDYSRTMKRLRALPVTIVHGEARAELWPCTDDRDRRRVPSLQGSMSLHRITLPFLDF